MKNFKPFLAIVVLSFVASSVSAYVTSIHAPAVIETENQGELTLMQLNLTPGTGIVQISGPSKVDSSTLSSAQTAAAYAASFLGLHESSYNFNYTISGANLSVSGPSGGLAFTLLAVAALQHRQLAPNIAVTGTISGDGSVGLIGGIYDKMNAASAGGMKYLLVPLAPSSSFEYLLYYLSQQSLGIPAIQVANVSQTIPYAFGSAAVSPLSVNLTQQYSITPLANANVTCSNCNASTFSLLANYTFNFVQSTVTNLSSNFHTARQQLMSNLQAYRTLESKGYIYSSANFAFLDFFSAYTLANTRYYNVTRAEALLTATANYCTSLVAPPLTNTNYEYVIGGKLRQYWANRTIYNSRALLGSEQTTDDIIQAIYNSASALGWCKASDESFTIAASLGGSPVDISPNMKSIAATEINKVRAYGTLPYLRAATQAYGVGDYATALYSAIYAESFSPSASTNNMTNAEIRSAVLQNIKNATYGIWPSQFSAQAEFYLGQAQFASGANVQNYLNQAYSISVLAKELSSANMQISNSFVASGAAASTSGFSEQIRGIQQSVSQIYMILLVNALLIFAMLIALLVHILSHREAVQTARQRRRRG